VENLLDLYRRRDMAGIWKRYCGFIDLSMDEFIASQSRQLEQQLRAWDRSALVKKLFSSGLPRTVAEFRERAPLTTYEDYAEALLSKKEEPLTEKSYTWVHTSGKSGEYEFKWVPYTRAMYEALSDETLACFLLGPCRRHGHIAIKDRDRLMFTMAPQPFVSGLCMQALHEQFSFRIWPDYDEGLKMDFFQRIREGIKLAFSEGIDYFYGITSVMLSISEQLENATSSGASEEMRSLLRKPRVILRLLWGTLKAKLRGDKLRPRDLWRVKGVMCSGMDSSIYKERIRTLWGEYPWEVYGCTEFGFMAFQHFASPGLVLRDSSCFYEFMDLDDYAKWKEDRAYRPPLRLLSEVDVDKEYVLVGTNLHGGVLVRYVLGDSLKILSLSDERIGLKLPQVMFSTRVDDIIDIAGFTRLTEKEMWTAIESTGISYVDWVVAKEYRDNNPILHIYLELRQDGHDPEKIRQQIHDQLKKNDQSYRDLEEMVNIRPLRITLLSRGTFSRYLQARQAAGIDLAHQKPPHMSPTPEVVEKLLAMSSLKF